MSPSTYVAELLQKFEEKKNAPELLFNFDWSKLLSHILCCDHSKQSHYHNQAFWGSTFRFFRRGSLKNSPLVLQQVTKSECIGVQLYNCTVGEI